MPIAGHRAKRTVPGRVTPKPSFLRRVNPLNGYTLSNIALYAAKSGDAQKARQPIRRALAGDSVHRSAVTRNRAAQHHASMQIQAVQHRLLVLYPERKEPEWMISTAQKGNVE
jgi:hypothetical protein